MGKLLTIDTKVPNWVRRLHHDRPMYRITPRFFRGITAGLGTDGDSPAVAYCTALRRIFCLEPVDFVEIFAIVGRVFNNKSACYCAARRIEDLLDHTTLLGAVERAEFNWGRDDEFGSFCHNAIIGCRRLLVRKFTERWRCLTEAMYHIAVLIEAVRHEVGGTVVDDRVERFCKARAINK